MNIGSSAWVSAMSDQPIMDRELRLFNYFDMDESCYNVCGTVQSGAAGVGIGWYRDFREAAEVIHRERSYEPDPQTQAAYAKHFAVYRQLYPMTRNAHEAVYAYRQENGQ